MSTNYHSHYRTLGLGPDTDWQQAQYAYRRLASRWHPDKHQNADGREQAEQAFVGIKLAFDAIREFYQLHQHMPLNQQHAAELDNWPEFDGAAQSATNPGSAVEDIFRATPDDSPAGDRHQPFDSGQHGFDNIDLAGSGIRREWDDDWFETDLRTELLDELQAGGLSPGRSTGIRSRFVIGVSICAALGLLVIVYIFVLEERLLLAPPPAMSIAESRTERTDTALATDDHPFRQAIVEVIE